MFQFMPLLLAVVEKTRIKVEKIDSPEKIIEGCIRPEGADIRLQGYAGVNLKKWKEAQDPSNAAISCGRAHALPKTFRPDRRVPLRGFSPSS